MSGKTRLFSVKKSDKISNLSTLTLRHGNCLLGGSLEPLLYQKSGDNDTIWTEAIEDSESNDRDSYSSIGSLGSRTSGPRFDTSSEAKHGKVTPDDS